MTEGANVSRFVTAAGRRIRVRTRASHRPGGLLWRAAAVVFGVREVGVHWYESEQDAVHVLRDGLRRYFEWADSDRTRAEARDPSMGVLDPEPMVQFWVDVERWRQHLEATEPELDPDARELTAILRAAPFVDPESELLLDPDVWAMAIALGAARGHLDDVNAGVKVWKATRRGGRARADKVKARDAAIAAEARRLLATGASRKQVANRLAPRHGLSPRTVQNLLSKLL